jgi:hypothetical protein
MKHKLALKNSDASKAEGFECGEREGSRQRKEDVLWVLSFHEADSKLFALADASGFPLYLLRACTPHPARRRFYACYLCLKTQSNLPDSGIVISHHLLLSISYPIDGETPAV